MDTTDGTIAAMTRHPRDHTSTVELADGTRWRLVPTGWGLIRAIEDGDEIARITRRSWLGRHWDLTATTWHYRLTSDPMPRRWHVTVGDQVVARISGSLISYNRVDIDAPIGVPLAATMLAWHVIARPWEAASRPAGLIPVIEPAPRPAAGAA